MAEKTWPRKRSSGIPAPTTQYGRLTLAGQTNRLFSGSSKWASGINCQTQRRKYDGLAERRSKQHPFSLCGWSEIPPEATQWPQTQHAQPEVSQDNKWSRQHSRQKHPSGLEWKEHKANCLKFIGASATEIKSKLDFDWTKNAMSIVWIILD